VAAAFDHRQSRDGDPQMHTHVAVLNRVRCSKDDQWRSIDGRELYAAAAAAGGMYDLARETALERSLGVVHEFRRPGDEVREIEGISDEVIAKFSSRRRAVEARLGPMLEEYEAKYGREASPFVRAQISEWATLDTRPAKGHGETVGAALARWEARERGFGTDGLARHWDAALDQRYRVGDAEMSLSDIVVATERHLVGEGHPVRLVDRNLLVDGVRRTLRGAGLSGREAGEVAVAGVERAVNGGALGLFDPQVLADAAVRRVSEKKATWTRSDLARQVERLDRRQPALGPGELQDRVDRLVDLALRPGGVAVPLVVDPQPEQDGKTSTTSGTSARLLSDSRPPRRRCERKRDARRRSSRRGHDPPATPDDGRAGPAGRRRPRQRCRPPRTTASCAAIPTRAP